MWNVQFADTFDREFDGLGAKVQDELLAQLEVIKKFGPAAKASSGGYAQGLEARQYEGASLRRRRRRWRVAFAFDPKRAAIVLVAGDKSGIANQAKFYKRLIKQADSRFDAHLASVKKR